MKRKSTISNHGRVGLVFLLSLALGACGSSSDDESEGLIKFYNASPNSPAIYLTVDENLDDDDDDEIEQTFAGVNYGSALTNQTLPTGTYFYELAWQDEDDRNRADLEIVFTDQLAINDEEIRLVVMLDDIQAPQVVQYAIPVIDDENDTDDDLFNLRFLNLATADNNMDMYMSKSDETFNEATFMGSLDYLELSDNHKLEEDQYVFYLTQAGTDNIVYESPEINYPFSNQNLLILRPSTGESNPYVLDNLGPTSLSSYEAIDADSVVRVYNGIQLNDVMPDYDGRIDVDLESFDGQAFDGISALDIGEFSSTQIVTGGDFSLDLVLSATAEAMVSRQLVSLGDNTNQTLFFYGVEQNVDEDGDGDVDEDGDGQVDEIELRIESLLIENSTRTRVFDHEVEMLNFIDNDDFDLVTVYFVKSDETISTAGSRRITRLGVPTSLILRNNTYEVFAVADIDGRDVILDTMELSLNEDSTEQFLLLETNTFAPSGYSMRLIPQVATE